MVVAAISLSWEQGGVRPPTIWAGTTVVDHGHQFPKVSPGSSRTSGSTVHDPAFQNASTKAARAPVGYAPLGPRSEGRRRAIMTRLEAVPIPMRRGLLSKKRPAQH